MDGQGPTSHQLLLGSCHGHVSLSPPCPMLDKGQDQQRAKGKGKGQRADYTQDQEPRTQREAVGNRGLGKTRAWGPKARMSLNVP